MLYLKMKLCGILISQYEMNYAAMPTVQEKEQHQSNIAAGMYQENIKNILLVNEEPIFFIDLLSKF